MLNLNGVTKFYRIDQKEIRAMDRVSLLVREGDFVALRGPSGSGKSTALNILGCLDRPDEGQYLLNGEDVGRLFPDQLAEVRNRSLGFVHQNFNLLPRLTVLENVELPLVYAHVKSKERLTRARRKLRNMGLADYENYLPKQLSGGQQQRVAIARALVNEAQILLADEPTGNLDGKASVEILSILSRLNERGTTVVLVTHEQDVAEWATYSINFRDGRIDV